MEAMFKLKSTVPIIADVPTAVPLVLKGVGLGGAGGSIRFDNVHFAYPSSPDR